MKPQELLRNWLKKNKMTAKDLAEKAGVNHSGIYRYLNGDTDSMRVSSALVLAHATQFELDVCDILGIPPRIVHRCLRQCEDGSRQCEKEDWSYMVDASACGINTPSSRIHTYSEYEKKTKAKEKPNPELQSNCLTLLDHWASAFSRQASRVRLSTKRARAVKAALADGRTVEDLRHSIEGHATNPWRLEAPSHNEFATLLRPENIEAGLELYAEQGLAEASPVDDSWVHEQMEAEGD